MKCCPFDRVCLPWCHVCHVLSEWTGSSSLRGVHQKEFLSIDNRYWLLPKWLIFNDELHLTFTPIKDIATTTGYLIVIITISRRPSGRSNCRMKIKFTVWHLQYLSLSTKASSVVVKQWNAHTTSPIGQCIRPPGLRHSSWYPKLRYITQSTSRPSLNDMCSLLIILNVTISYDDLDTLISDAENNDDGYKIDNRIISIIIQ